MSKDYIPSSDPDFLAWADNLSTRVTAEPTAVGLTAAIATVLAGKYTAFADALKLATEPETRGGSNILAKDTLRADLEGYCRQLARAIQGTLTVTNQQRYDLGLTVRDTQPASIPAPGFAPKVDVTSMTGHTMEIQLSDVNSPRRGRPPFVQGASVFSFVGPTPPADIASWKFEGSTSRTNVEIVFPSALAAGTKVWVTAFWCNAKLQSGPACEPISALIQFGGLSQAA